MSDATGKIPLTKHKKALHESYNRYPNGLWVVYDSHVKAPLLSPPEDENWTDRQKLMQALMQWAMPTSKSRLATLTWMSSMPAGSN